MDKIQCSNPAGEVIYTNDLLWIRSGYDVNGVECDQYLTSFNTTIWLNHFEDTEVEVDPLLYP
jgi:hypothetical protein